MTTSKRTLRRRLRQARRALSATDLAANSQAVCRSLASSALLLQHRSVACYLARDGEVDLAEFWRLRWARGLPVALPVLEVRSNTSLMSFYDYSEETELRGNHFDILEPFESTHVPTIALAAVLAPLVAFDESGHRLGMGGGYYDRAFGDADGDSRPLLIGVAHELQRIESLDAEPWDVPLDAVVTERGFQFFRGSAQTLALY